MSAYLIVAAMLFGLALAATLKPSLNLPAVVIGTAILALFSGLRFETGYDWPAYEVHFDNLRTVSEICSDIKSEVTILVEPLYQALAYSVKQSGGTIWGVFFVCAVFNMAVIAYVCWRIAPASVLPALVVYYGFAYLIAQFAALRQGVGSSLVLLALLFAAHRQYFKSAIGFGAAASFHISTILFAPVAVLARFLPSWKLSAVFVAIGIGLAIMAVDAVRPVVWLATEFGPQWVAAKAQFYAHMPPTPVSLATAGLIGFHVVVLGMLYFASSTDERQDIYVRTGVWLCLFTLGAHLYLASFPSFWNRFMLISIPWEVAAVYRLEWVRSRPMWLRLGALTGMSIVSTAALVFMLAKPASRPFIPYQSLVHVALGDIGDGRERADKTFADFAPRLPDGVSPTIPFDDGDDLSAGGRLLCRVLGYDTALPPG